MDYKQLKIMAMALSLPGSIIVAGLAYQYVNEKQLIPNYYAIFLFALGLFSYLYWIIKVLMKSKK